MKEEKGTNWEDTSRFGIGTLVMTNGIHNRCREDILFWKFVRGSLARFIRCDWGELSDADREQNDQAVTDGGRLHGVYKKDDVEIWIITEWERSVTTILFPNEY